MGSYTRTYSLTDGTTAYGSQVAFELDALGSSVNNIVNSQISSGAAIADSKFAQITTPSKVSGAAITLLTSVPSGAGILPVANGGLFVATQAEVEAATSATVGLTPLNAKYHPGVAKVWLNWDGSAASPITPTIAYGISGTTITKGSTGVYTITFATNFSSTNYTMVSQAWDTTVPVSCNIRMLTKNVGSVVIECYRSNTGTLTDAEEMNISIYGDF